MGTLPVGTITYSIDNYLYIIAMSHFGKSDAFSEKAGFAHMNILHIKSEYTHMKTPRKEIYTVCMK